MQLKCTDLLNLSVNRCVRNALRQMGIYYRNSNVVLKNMKLPSYFNSVHYRYNLRNIYSKDICGFLHDISNTKLAIKSQVKSQKVLHPVLYHHYWLYYRYLKISRMKIMPDFFFFCPNNIYLMNLSNVFLNIYLFIL